MDLKSLKQVPRWMWITPLVILLWIVAVIIVNSPILLGASIVTCLLYGIFQFGREYGKRND